MTLGRVAYICFLFVLFWYIPLWVSAILIFAGVAVAWWLGKIGRPW